ncbi:hypothetical protein [Altererythrobacter sp.]|uniref:hypothetical protein n=1 Tax=Altererythrobacter sp. TaxID=1872480 RepID=UPI003D080784
MRALFLTGGAALALGASIALAQDAPESLLPPGFDDPVPAPSPAPAPRPAAPTGPAPTGPATPAPATTGPVVQPIPGAGESIPDLGDIDLSSVPSVEELEAMSPDELDELLGLKPKYDIPPAARRALTRVGVIAPSEGGLPSGSLARQPAALVRAILAESDGPFVSRWGHMLMRRALASRLAAPEGMNPVEFAALRAAALNRMGEHATARALVQDVDTGNWDEKLTDAALNAYLGTEDIVGICPAVRFQGGERDDSTWKMLRAICSAYAGEGALAGSQLDRMQRENGIPRIDVLLAQRFAGAAGRGRRAVEIEWDGVEELNPWRFALANAVGEDLPDGLIEQATPYYQRIWATAPMLPLQLRARGADRAASDGLLSAAAMVDLYSQIYSDDTIEGEEADRAVQLRDAYVGSDPTERLAAMQSIWGGDSASNYGRYVLTAYAAARMPADSGMAASAAPLIASMLAAGLDRDAMTWLPVVEQGSNGWAQLMLARPDRSGNVSSEGIDGFIDDDGSADQRRSRFLLAGLAGLGRIDRQDLNDFSGRLEVDLSRQSKWSRTIDRAAEVNNRALVALLAGLGMQGSGWDRMTAMHLYHIVSALNRVGLNAEARMIAAEAVARG